ncbi:MAG: DUF4230 domain-containing protein [Bacteroides sp.]|nr:DUF4230 domain-containing protein [Bacteroides sp.]
MRKWKIWMGGIAWMCLFMGCSSGNRQEEAAEPMQDIISALNDIPKLYLVEAKVDKVLLMNDQEWYTIGNRKCMIPVTAQVKAGIDLSNLKDVRMEGEDIYLTLPAPFIEIESSEIRHDEVQTSVGLLRSNFTQDEFSQFANRGRRSIEQALPGMGLVERCQEQARTMLSLMIRKLGKNPVIEVPKYNTEEVEKMIIYKDKQK